MSLITLRTGDGRRIAPHDDNAPPDAESQDTRTFEMVRLADATPGSGDQVCLRDANGYYLSAADGGGGHVAALYPWVGAWERFTLTHVDPGIADRSEPRTALKSASGHFLRASHGNSILADREESGPSDTLIVETLDSGTPSLFVAREDAVTRSGARRMYTEATYFPDQRRIFARTHTWNNVKLTGFTGGVALVFLNNDGRAVGAGSVHTFGVDGTWIRRANRWDTWEEMFTVDVPWLTEVRGVGILHTHAGRNRLPEIIREAVSVGKLLVDVYSQLNALRPKD